ncbi:MAG TPA: cytochrome c oxidase subunit II [Bryobacteraceae bacterium]|nr:cytochrome c oxidase subunit II [Bryobacteraceae bacterium]
MKPLALISLPLLAVLQAGCNQQSSLSPGGPAARELSRMNWFILILFIVIAVVMWILIALVASRPRGSLREHAPVDAGGGHEWVWIGGFAIPAAILAVVFVVGLRGMSKFPLHDGMAHTPAEIRITGHQWWWDVQYLNSNVSLEANTANEIHIPAGRAVDIDLASNDVIHSFWVPSLHGKVDLIPGQFNRIRIQADQPGVYRGQCAEYCGEQHAHMILLVVAQSPDEYERWLGHQRELAIDPADDQQRRGQTLFTTRACGLCHTISGTLAQGRVGPNLSHLASRQAIAANMLPNNTANLSAWVVHARSLKPGVVMPNMTQFDGNELRALVAYLQHLR